MDPEAVISRCSTKQLFLRNFQNLQEKTCNGASNTGIFFANIIKLLKTIFFYRTASQNRFAGGYQLNYQISLKSLHHLLCLRSSHLDMFYKKVVLKISKQKKICDADTFTKVLQLCYNCRNNVTLSA